MMDVMTSGLLLGFLCFSAGLVFVFIALMLARNSQGRTYLRLQGDPPLIADDSIHINVDAPLNFEAAVARAEAERAEEDNDAVLREKPFTPKVLDRSKGLFDNSTASPIKRGRGWWR